MPLMAAPIALVGVPTALGGHLSGMQLSPAGLRALGLVEMLRARPEMTNSHPGLAPPDRCGSPPL